MVTRAFVAVIQVVVEFDGMGPTWTVLVEKGLELYPNATHGILSDADFTPVITHLDKRQLKMECSKHMYKIRFLTFPHSSRKAGTTVLMSKILCMICRRGSRRAVHRCSRSGVESAKYQ